MKRELITPEAIEKACVAAREQGRLTELERCARIAELAGAEADAEKDAATSETERSLAAGSSITAWAIAAGIRSEK